MKTVLLVTLHSQNNNFGSVIQGNSLYTYVKQLGYDVSVLDYRPAYSNGSPSFPARCKRLATNMLYLSQYLRRERRFNEFVNSEKLTTRYTTFDELTSAAMKFDIYLVGSDQVWNSEHNCGKDDAYYLKFTESPAKISYAASLGRYISNKRDIETLIGKIRDFDAVSVRERLSAEQLVEHGMPKVKYVLDPVFLYSAAHYRTLQSACGKSGYILAYIIHTDPFIADVTEKLARLMHKKIIQIGGLAVKCKYDEFPRDVGPREFLSLVDNADFVITSSFHGTAFSIIYEKQFAVVMPRSNTLRLENILETAGLSDRIIRTMDDVEKMTDPVLYTAAAAKIDKMRKTSQKYLTDAMNNTGGQHT